MSPMQKDRIIAQELMRVKDEIPALDGFPGDVQRVLRCLREHLFEEAFDVNAIIASTGVRKGEIYGQFKVYVGMSLRQYREDRRMKAARLLLGYVELKIYLIAYRLGYTSHSSFARAFRKCVGCSPAVYREKMCRENVIPCSEALSKFTTGHFSTSTHTLRGNSHDQINLVPPCGATPGSRRRM